MKQKKLIFDFSVNRNWNKLTDSRKRAKILADNRKSPGVKVTTPLRPSVNTSGHLQKQSELFSLTRLILLRDRKSSCLPSTDGAESGFFDPVYIT